jgi:hypothetical protein
LEGHQHLESEDSSLEESKIGDENSPKQKDYQKKMDVEIASLNVSLICKNSLGVRKEVVLIHFERP